LAPIPGVSDVEVDLGVVLPQEAAAGAGYYPTRGMLRFRLYFPVDEQKKLAEFIQFIAGAADNFVVMVLFRYLEPVMFVIPDGSASWRDTFSGVVVVRGYLQREFSCRELPVDIRVIGPTPLHVDSWV